MIKTISSKNKEELFHGKILKRFLNIYKINYKNKAFE